MPAIKGKPVPARRSRVTLVCTICSASYEQHTCRAETSKFCSRACWGRRAPRAECLRCKTEFRVDHDHARYCSESCRLADMVGPRSASWKGGVSFVTERGRMNRELRRWKKTVIERDGGRCRECGATENIHAHHVKPWADFPKLRFALSNGIAICVDCHSHVHGRKLGGGWKTRRETASQR